MSAIQFCWKASTALKTLRHLFPYIADGIRECQPRIVFLENVEGIISAKTADGESVLQYVLRELEGLGYRATAGVFSAAEVGAPHQRKRVFILAYSATVGIQRSGRPNKEGSSHTIEGCGDGASSTREELGNTEHNGCAAQQELRGDEEASDQWRKEESSKTRESEGASRPIDVPSVQGCTEGSKSEELAHPHSSESSKGRGDNGEVPEVSSVKRADLGPLYLEEKVIRETQNWPTPRAGNPGSRKPGTGGKILAEEAKIHNGPPDQANHSTTGKSQESQQWPAPRANKVHPVITEENREQLANRKKANLEEEIAGHCGKAQGKLNPDWVEQLMGLPTGWTDLGSWATE